MKDLNTFFKDWIQVSIPRDKFVEAYDWCQSTISIRSLLWEVTTIHTQREKFRALDKAPLFSFKHEKDAIMFMLKFDGHKYIDDQTNNVPPNL